MPKKATNKTSDTPSESPEAKKSYVPTTMTGLQDYAYWWQYARERAKTAKKDTKEFRRGRIWA
ncbi:MAG: cyanobactin biosynthesis PatC/TenC/TruC family protein [Spirulina sp. SIO3F2]|nr:cyanobactin biosynthesis PatC/TenC/TruC family protein [Spirulina sp. SIO3F2]